MKELFLADEQHTRNLVQLFHAETRNFGKTDEKMDTCSSYQSFKKASVHLTFVIMPFPMPQTDRSGVPT